MCAFGSIIDANVHQIEELKRQVAERQQQLSARLHVGTKLYDRLRQGEGISEAWPLQVSPKIKINRRKIKISLKNVYLCSRNK